MRFKKDTVSFTLNTGATEHLQKFDKQQFVVDCCCVEAMRMLANDYRRLHCCQTSFPYIQGAHNKYAMLERPNAIVDMLAVINLSHAMS